MAVVATDCSTCGHVNPDGARFCGDCGLSLAAPAPCPSCGAANPAGQKFCNGCGAKLAPARTRKESVPSAYIPSYMADRIRAEGSALKGERKQVTVMFADVTGSMELAGQVDPEDWRHVMDRFFALLCEGVHRFEGTVNKFTGDGIMALFGAPLAHEDHAARACYAALHLHEELARYAGELRREQGLNFSVRMGLNSGEVVVGAVGEDLNLDYTAIGHTVGLASRMEALAEPGKTYLTEATAALVRGWFDLRELGAFGVKGVTDPVRVFELGDPGSAHTRVEAAARERGLSLFVGRNAEIDLLENALARAQEGGVGQVVGVVADPGLGKSRLCYEFIQRCRAHGYEVHEGHGVAHGKRIPLLPVLEMMRSYFGIDDDDSDRQARDKIAGRLLLLDDEFKELLPVLFDFLGVPDPDRPPATNPEARQRQLLAAVRRLVEVGGRQNRTVILVEDLHWLDPGSDFFLANLIEGLASTTTLLVANFRPEYRADWMSKSYYQQLPLLPLGRDAIVELLRDLLGADPSLDGLAELVAERTGGNPFYIEEVVQSLVDNGSLEGSKGGYRLSRSVEEIAIPPTVQAVLAARIDRLGETDKEVLRTAAVIGRDFSERTLRRIVDLEEHELADSLRKLSAAEFIYERSLYPHAEYSFKHPLTEEVAYRSQLAERRAETHAAVAEAITAIEADRLDELAALIANHWEQARQPVESAKWKSRAAAWAGQNHPRDALSHWRAARALLREQPATPEIQGMLFAACFWILQLGGWRMGMPEAEIAEVFADGKQAAEYLGDARPLIAMNASYGLARGFLGNVDEALALAQEAHRLAEEVGDDELLVGSGRGYWLAIAGRVYEATLDLDEVIERSRGRPELGRSTVGFSAHAWAHVFKGFVLLPLAGRPREGLELMEEGLALAREYGDVESIGWAHGGVPSVRAWLREPADSLAHAREALSIAERLGSNFSRATAYSSLGLAHAARDEWEEADAALRRGLELLRDSRAGIHYEPLMLANLARVTLARGDAAGAVSEAAEAAELARHGGTPPYEVMARIELARALLEEGEPTAAERARSALEGAMELIRDTGAVLYEPDVHEQLADVAAAEGDNDARERHLREAHRLFTDFGAPARAEQVQAELERLHA